MKTKSIIALLLSILFVVSVFTGCKTTEGASTPDEIETTSSVLETTTIVETAAETTVVPTTEPTTTVPVTSEPATEKEDKQETNNNQNNNSTNNTNNSNNNTSNTNNNSTSNNKPKPTQPKPIETKPVETEPQVITDDTPLTYEMANNAEVFQRLCDDANNYFATLGMRYEPSLNPDVHGWFIGHNMGLNWGCEFSYNERSSRNIEGIKERVDGIFIDYYGYTYESIRYNAVYRVDDDGNYSVIFCYG